MFWAAGSFKRTQKRSVIHRSSLLADKTNDAGGVERARTFDLHDVNVAL